MERFKNMLAYTSVFLGCLLLLLAIIGLLGLIFWFQNQSNMPEIQGQIAPVLIRRITSLAILSIVSIVFIWMGGRWLGKDKTTISDDLDSIEI